MTIGAVGDFPSQTSRFTWQAIEAAEPDESPPGEPVPVPSPGAPGGIGR